MLSPESIAALKAQLLDRRAELEGIADSAAEAAGTVTLDQTRVGRVSRMDALQRQAMAQESDRRRVLELKRIAAALERIESEDYGFCVRCDELIAEARLSFDPAVTLCVVCAESTDGG